MYIHSKCTDYNHSDNNIRHFCLIEIRYKDKSSSLAALHSPFFSLTFQLLIFLWASLYLFFVKVTYTLWILIFYILYLNYPCHSYRSIHHRMHNWAPFYLVESKVYVDMDSLFLFLFCLAICLSKKRMHHVTHYLFTEKVLSLWHNFNSRNLFHTMTKFLPLCVFVIRNLLRILYT